MGFIVGIIESETKQQDAVIKTNTWISGVELTTHSEAHIPGVT